MKRRGTRILMLVAVAALVMLSVTAPAVQSEKNAEVALKNAMNKETVDGDLKAAIEQYKAIVETYAANHAVAAKALVRMGHCYEKLFDAETREARMAYEQVLIKFGDQKEAVEQARSRLAALGAGGHPGPQSTRLVWTGSKVALGGRISPDGRSISFPDWSTGNLALHDLTTGADRPLTKTGSFKKGEEAYAEDSAFSRDGKQVAYAWYDHKIGRYVLRIANLNGDPNPRHLFDRGDIQWLSPQDWSPDGKWIAARLALKGHSKAQQISLIAVQDGSLRVLNSVEWRNPGDLGRVFFSRDGKYLAYDRVAGKTGRQHDLFALAIDEGREIPVAAGPTHEELVGWSPDGKCLLFTSDRTGSIGLWALVFAGGSPLGNPELVKPNIGRIVPLGLVADGALYYGVRTGRVLSRIQVASFDFDTGKFLSPPVDVAPEGTLESNRSPDWSPDGKFLAYVSRSAAGSESLSIKIRSSETGAVRELQQKTSLVSLIRWAPDGRSFLAVGLPGQINRVDAETGEAVMLRQTKNRIGYSPAWSLDGKKIYYCTGSSPDMAFIELDIASGSERELIRRSSLGMVWMSPDGRHIATGSNDLSANARTFLIIPVAGGEPREVMRVDSGIESGDLNDLTQGARLLFLKWSPDSRSVLIRKLSADRNQAEELWQVSLDGSEPRKLDVKLPFNRGTGIHVSPDGRQIAIVPAAEQTAMQSAQAASGASEQVYVLENFLPGPPAAPRGRTK